MCTTVYFKFISIYKLKELCITQKYLISNKVELNVHESIGFSLKNNSKEGPSMEHFH